MFRMLIASAAVMIAGSLTPVTAADPAFKLGETLEDELTDTLGVPFWPGFVDTYRAYGTEIPVALKAGQNLSLTATVLGKDRTVSVALMDSTGKIVAASKRNTEVKTVRLEVEEISATGKYKIIVMSDRIGKFTLRATGTSDEDLDEKALEEKLKRLKKEVEETEAKLKALKAKKKP